MKKKRVNSIIEAGEKILGKRRNNPANVVKEVAAKQGVGYHDVMRKAGLVVRMHNPTLDKHVAYMKRCEERRNSGGKA